MKTPANVSAAEFVMIAKPDPTKYPVPPYKPKKSDFYRALILNTLLSKNVDPENHVDKAVFTKKVEIWPKERQRGGSTGCQKCRANNLHFNKIEP